MLPHLQRKSILKKDVKSINNILFPCLHHHHHHHTTTTNNNNSNDNNSDRIIIITIIIIIIIIIINLGKRLLVDSLDLI